MFEMIEFNIFIPTPDITEGPHKAPSLQIWKKTTLSFFSTFSY